MTLRLIGSKLKSNSLLAFNTLMAVSIAFLVAHHLETIALPTASLPLAQSVIALSALVIVMPILLLSEMLVSAVVVKPVKKKLALRSH